MIFSIKYFRFEVVHWFKSIRQTIFRIT